METWRLRLPNEWDSLVHWQVGAQRLATSPRG
jgi:hypothetical protein